MIAISLMSAFQCVESDDLLAAYSELSRTEYSWEELQERPLPPGVDPAKIETYLADSVFMVSLGFSISMPRLSDAGGLSHKFIAQCTQRPLKGPFHGQPYSMETRNAPSTLGSVFM